MDDRDAFRVAELRVRESPAVFQGEETGLRDVVAGICSDVRSRRCGHASSVDGLTPSHGVPKDSLRPGTSTLKDWRDSSVGEVGGRPGYAIFNRH
jgi:hypothetical protein